MRRVGPAVPELAVPGVTLPAFSVRGQPDGWGPPYLLLLLLVMGVGLYWVLTTVAHHPDLLARANTTAATPEGQVRQLALCRQLLLGLRAFVVLLLVTHFVAATLVATGMLQQPGAWLMPAEMASLGILIGAYIVATLRVR